MACSDWIDVWTDSMVDTVNLTDLVVELEFYEALQENYILDTY